MRSWYLIPYRQVNNRGLNECWTLDLNMPNRDFHTQILTTEGHWTESQQDNRMALVCVRTTPALHADLALVYQSVLRPDLVWEETRAKFPGSPVRHWTKTIGEIESECFDDDQLIAIKRLSDETFQQAAREGYARVGGTPVVQSYLLQRAARHGYGLDRISPGTFPTTGILDTFSVDAGPPPSAAWGGTHNGGALALKSAGGVCVIDSNFGTSYYNTQFEKNQEAYATLTASSGNYFGLYTRLQSPGSAAVDGYITYFSDSTKIVDIWRVDNNTDTQIYGGAVLSHGFAIGDSGGAEAIESRLTAYSKVGGVWYTEIAIPESTYVASGYIGLTIQNVNITVDNFGGGTILAPGITSFGRSWFPKGKLRIPIARGRR